jgi:hypothetical protein
MAILAQRFPIFQKSMRIISSITNASPAVVTTTFNHQYITGMIVRLNIPEGFGMVQANQLYGPIIVTGDTTFTIAIDTTKFDAFAAPSSFPLNRQSAQVTPIGEVNTTLKSATQNVLPYPANYP